VSVSARPPCDAGVVLHAGPCAGFAPAARRRTLAAAIVGSAMAFIDGSVVNVALPAIQGELGATAAQMQWVVEAYALLLSSLLLAGGALGDRLGRKAVFMAGVAVFTAASAACALAPSAPWLIAARAVQGLGAALLVPGSLALIGAAYPQAERGAAIGTWSALGGVAAAAGPVLGGWLVERYHWSWAFLVNVPLGVALWLLCAWGVPESRNNAQGGPIDGRGAALVTLGLAGIVFAFIQAPAHGWLGADVAASLVVGVIGLAAFVSVERHAAAPMVPLGLFANRDFSGANLLTLLLYAALGGGLYYLPLNLIQVQGYGAAAAGAAMLPFIALMFLLSRWSGRIVDRFGARLPLVVGPVTAAAGFVLFMRPGVGGNYWLTFFPAVLTLGLGMALTVAPLTTTVMNAVGADQAGVASGVNNAVSRAAGLLAIAIFGIVMARVFDAQLAQALQATALSPAVVEAVLRQRDQLAGIVTPPGLPAATAEELRQAIGSAFVAGFRTVMALCAALALLGAFSAAWLIGQPPARGPRD
jgi:EmrB/QacA subfamily drug resistance transporter